MKYKITNKTGMRLRYSGIKFEPRETKIVDSESTYEHKYFKVEKLKKIKSTKLNEELEKKEKKIKL